MFTGMAEGGARYDPGARAAGAAPGGDGTAAGAGDRARAALAGTRFADVRWVATTGSTNADAMALARDGAPEGIVVVADHQRAGRGRRNRTWVAPPRGSLLLSVLLRPPARVAGAVTMAAALAMAEAVDLVAGVAARLKWPNDLVVATADGERKLAGILAEADWPAGSTISGGYRAPGPRDRTVVVVGIGLNVRWPGDPGPDPASPGGDAGTDVAEVAGLATALNWLGADVDRVDLLVAFLRRLGERYAGLVAAGAGDMLDDWRRRSATLGKRVRVDLGADDIEGTAVDVTGEGHLVVDVLEGGRRTVAVGDVVHLRTA
jgi:BirA family transcriptional regulator, biotin operon repressor / biotin---[acetyl-CoA-carboxylase] ligase